LALVHEAPAEQAVHAPEHTPPSQGSPASTLVVETPVGAEPLQSIAPRAQTFVGVQAAPIVQGWQVVSLQNPPPPQRVPAGAVPTGSHRSMPLGHEVRPVSQGFGGRATADAHRERHEERQAHGPQSAKVSDVHFD
jgi:hypothetical protein